MSDVIPSHIMQNEPFGPTNAGDVSLKDIKAFSFLFVAKNLEYEKIRSRPTIIVGRRGAGKTHYLRNIVFNHHYDYYVEIRTPRVLRYVAKIVQGISEDIIFSETIAEVWEMIFWIAIFSEMRRQSLLPPEKDAFVEEYLGNFGVRKNDNVDQALLAFANFLMNHKRNETISEPIGNFENITFEEAKNTILNSLESSKTSLVIFIDSMYDFQLDISSVGRALQGLLILVGSMNKPRDVVDVCFCLPSELYQKFVKLSFNPIKDFRRALVLQWNEEELVLIGAQRLMSHLTQQYPEFCKKFVSLDLTNYSDALKLLSAVLPKHVKNQFGYKEEAIFYILRHTQLLPRHFLVLLNSVFANLDDDQRASPFPVGERQVINGVEQIKDLILREILLAFQLTYPTAEETCLRCLPELGYIFTINDLRRVFDEHVKAVFGNDRFDEFLRMLVEIGVVGKVSPNTDNDIYIEGDFEYSVSRQLALSEKDDLCIHPLFSSFFQRNSRQDRPIYPSRTVDTGEKSLTNKRVFKKIFVSYRRSDSADIAGRIYDRLVQVSDRNAVFKDVDSIPAGRDFRVVIDDAVKECEVFLVIIGKQWLETKNDDGVRRLDDPEDFVKLEIESALKRDIPVVPILVQGASVPPANKLPAEIKELSYRNGLQVRPDPDFHKDMDRLIREL